MSSNATSDKPVIDVNVDDNVAHVVNVYDTVLSYLNPNSKCPH